MRQETVNIYKFNELSEQAKEVARDWYRGCSTSDDFDFCIEDAVRMGEMIGIEFDTHAVKLHGGGTRYDANIYWSGFCSQGDGASFEGTYRYKKGALKALQAECPAQWTDKDGTIHESKGNKELHDIARVLQREQARYFYQIVTRVSQSGRYSHENTMSFEHERADEKELEEGADTECIEEMMRDFARWIYTQLEQENDYRNSDEYIDETIEANEYEFLENGERA